MTKAGCSVKGVGGQRVHPAACREDTTANTLCWTLYLLHTHREAWRALVADVDRLLGADTMPRSFDVTRELESIEHCASESMRLRPVAPMFFMENNRATTLDGIAIPAGVSSSV